MKRYFYISVIGIALLLIYSIVQAQTTEKVYYDSLYLETHDTANARSYRIITWNKPHTIAYFRDYNMTGAIIVS